jgi:hypothetical protein
MDYIHCALPLECHIIEQFLEFVKTKRSLTVLKQAAEDAACVWHHESTIEQQTIAAQLLKALPIQLLPASGKRPEHIFQGARLWKHISAVLWLLGWRLCLQ